jgi:hypothetical protein
MSTIAKHVKIMPGLAKKKVIFHQENACLHVYHCHSKIKIITPTLFARYSSISSLSLNFSLVDRGSRFSSNEELIARIEEYFGVGLEEYNFRHGLKEMEHQRNKCISVKKTYNV